MPWTLMCTPWPRDPLGRGQVAWPQVEGVPNLQARAMPKSITGTRISRAVHQSSTASSRRPHSHRARKRRPARAALGWMSSVSASKDGWLMLSTLMILRARCLLRKTRSWCLKTRRSVRWGTVEGASMGLDHPVLARIINTINRRSIRHGVIQITWHR